MFYNVKVHIALFYAVTVFAYIYLFVYLRDTLALPLVVSIGILTVLILLSAYLIASLALEPLMQYIRRLKALSSQTLHELNLPIATIQTNTALLRKKCSDSADEKLGKRLQRIDEATKMLRRRYDELDYLIKTQTLKKIREPFDVETVVRQRVTFLRGIYPSYRFVCELSRLSIVGDPYGLAKTVDNIIDNAVKYSPKNGTVYITLRNNTLTIRDEGKGIEDAELIRIFDAYYRGDGHTEKGFGIGLTLVKQYCDDNDIELRISSKVEAGTSVSLHFKG